MKGMKKKERRDLLMRIGAVLIVICMIAALALPAFAADAAGEDKPYSYTVRIFPGDKGTINGSKAPIVREVEPGSKWGRADFDISQAAPDDPDRYYVMGLREAGRDNNTTDVMFRSGSFTVDRDIDLVVSYGIRGSDVEYTIHYVEYGTNKVLHDPETYHGNDGDQPAVAYLYIEGYLPREEVISDTIKAGSANDWTFYYVNKDEK